MDGDIVMVMVMVMTMTMGAHGWRCGWHDIVVAPSPAPAEQDKNTGSAQSDADTTIFVMTKNNNGECDDNDEVSGEEVVNLSPAKTDADCSLLREEVENSINSTTFNEINVEKFLQSVMVD
eukprot:8784352-Ditylum_brightwellii.AAC.1